jgi:hypothetical protein
MIRCLTLLDITKNQTPNQLKNWNTLLQALTLRSEVVVHNFSKKIFRNIDSLGFGSSFSGEHNVWVFDFELLTPHTVCIENDELYYLREDTHLVPMITGLEETVKCKKNCLVHDGPNQNISFLLL